MSFVTTEIQDAVAVLTIDRPKALNALNPEVLADLKAAFEAIDQNTVRCVVLTGAGDKSFVAGADIGSMSTMTLSLIHISYPCSPYRLQRRCRHRRPRSSGQPC